LAAPGAAFGGRDGDDRSRDANDVTGASALARAAPPASDGTDAAGGMTGASAGTPPTFFSSASFSRVVPCAVPVPALRLFRARCTAIQSYSSTARDVGRSISGMSTATKTTFHLSDSRRARLKVLAARSGKTVTQLLEEGADLVLDKYGARHDQAELERRARAARERLRQGLYSGPPVVADEVLYPRPRRKRGR
jgi:hypothetical protein